MALITEGSRCALCEQRLDLEPNWFATSGVFLPQNHPLWRYCDAPMHWSCYETWPNQRQFARHYFEVCLSRTELNPYWGESLRLPNTFVEVCANERVQEARVHLAQSGTAIQVPLAEWGGWISDLTFASLGLCALERKALAGVWPSLRERLPNQAAVIDGVDWDAKVRLSTEMCDEAAQLETDRNAAVDLHNRHWSEMREFGAACPFCSEPSNIRLVDRSPEDKSYFICRSCFRSFGPDDVQISCGG